MHPRIETNERALNEDVLYLYIRVDNRLFDNYMDARAPLPMEAYGLITAPSMIAPSPTKTGGIITLLGKR